MAVGFYIQTPENHNKAAQIEKLYGASPILSRPIPKPSELGDTTLALICVVKNPLFDAAALVYSDREYEDFSDPSDPRSRTWLLLDKEKAYELSGFEPEKYPHLLD